MRSNTLDAARRAYLGLVRGVIMASDDTQMMQTVDARLMHNELLTGIERPQSYGFNSVPVPPDENGAKGAELVVGFINGNRSHPMVLAEGDRRSRPKNWQQGDSGLWHYQGATARFTQNGYVHDAGANKKPATWTVGSLFVSWADGKALVQVGGTSGPAVVVKAGGVYLGGDPDQGGSYALVQTVSGPSTNVYAKIG